MKLTIELDRNALRKFTATTSVELLAVDAMMQLPIASRTTSFPQPRWLFRFTIADDHRPVCKARRSSPHWSESDGVMRR